MAMRFVGAGLTALVAAIPAIAQTAPVATGQDVAIRSAKGLAANGVVPIFAEPTGTTTCEMRGVIDGLNRCWNPDLTLQFNYIRFAGDNTSLDPVGAKAKGDIRNASAYRLVEGA